VKSAAVATGGGKWGRFSREKWARLERPVEKPCMSSNKASPTQLSVTSSFLLCRRRRALQPLLFTQRLLAPCSTLLSCCASACKTPHTRIDSGQSCSNVSLPQPPDRGAASPTHLTQPLPLKLTALRKQWRRDHPFGFYARPARTTDGGLDLKKWNCGIPGKDNTIWRGGLLKLDLLFPDGVCALRSTMRLRPN
jgi:hypothetical protein